MRFTFRRMRTTCWTISEGVKFRKKPCLPDSQKIQPTGQPTWVLTQAVPPSRRLMNTVSIQRPSDSS